MDWVDKPQNYKDFYGILQLSRFSHFNNFRLKTLKLGWVAFHLVTFQLKCLDFQSNQYKELVPVLSLFCNGLFNFFLAAAVYLRWKLQDHNTLRIAENVTKLGQQYYYFM